MVQVLTPTPSQYPSIFLPPLNSLPSQSITALEFALGQLRALFTPDVRGTKPYDASQGDLELPHSDWERSYAVRWLTGFLARSDLLELSIEGDDELPIADGARKLMVGSVDALLEDAASLLSLCSGLSASSSITRILRFPTLAQKGESVGKDIEVRVTDGSINSHDHPGAVGMHTWGGAFILSELIALHPEQFLPFNSAKPRVLELGAGTGLVTLVIAKSLNRLPKSFCESCVVVSTDYDPLVLSNLRSNIIANFPPSVQIQTHTLDWESFHPPSPSMTVAEDGYDAIFAADVVYEPEQAAWLKSTVECLLRRPSAIDREKSRPYFHLVIPIRATHAAESASVLANFPRAIGSNVGGEMLGIVSSQEFEREDGTEKGDVVRYVYYRIGWMGNHYKDVVTEE